MLPDIGFTLFFIILFHKNDGFNLNAKSGELISDPEGNNESFFGFSVAFQKRAEDSHAIQDKSNPWLIVGSPRSNISYLKSREPGDVFKCYRNSQSCDSILNEVLLAGLKGLEVPEPDKNLQYWAHSWIGAVVETYSYHTDNIILACGPHYGSNHIPQAVNSLAGICFVLNGTGATAQLPPKPTEVSQVDDTGSFEERRKRALNNRNFGRGSVRFNSNFFTQEPIAITTTASPIPSLPRFIKGNHSMFGISADFEKVRDGWSALIGSINLKTWNGEISKLEGHTNRTKEFLKDDPDENEQIKNSYFGYAITVGKSDSEDLLYVSSPRSRSVGKVEVYKKQEGDVYPYRERVYHGKQTGEMFGASLCAADFNGDGVEDLIVGAPFYAGSELSFNEGRISVILSRGSRMYAENNYFYGERNKAGSQFGLALSAIGDLNMDGLPDIAVGAPHEDDIGAIYIFLGDRQNGIRLSQHIKASDIDRSLKGFGISMTGGQDIDSNGFDDIGVGCYLSSNVVLLKTKPIIKLRGSLGILSDFKEGKISVNSEPLLIYACVLYEQGYSKTDVAYVRIDIDVDQELKRTKSVQLNSTLVNSALKGNQIKVDTEIAYNTQFCLNFTFQLQEEIKNRNNELLIEMRFSTVTDDERCKKKECPMIDQNLENEVTKLRLPFKTYTTDLQLSSKFINTNGSNYMHSAGNKNLAIEVKIVNKKDMAISTKLEIKMPSILSVKYVEGNERCKASYKVLTQTEAAKTDYYCNFQNVERNEEPTIILHVSTSDLTEDVDDLIFNFTVSSASKELDIRDNDSSLQLFVHVDTPLFISGFANPPEIIISKAVEDEANNDFKHTFDVSNKSPMKLTVSVNITVPIPVIVSDAERVPMFLLQSKLSNGSQLSCSSDADENMKKYFNEWNDIGLPNQDFTRGLSEKLKSSAKNVMKSNFDCNHQSQSTESLITLACVNISCSNFLFHGNATIEVRMRSSYKVFDYLIGTDGTRKFITRASVFLSRYRQKFNLHGNLETAVETPISINSHKSPIWPFILAIVLSLVLLILITYGLYKAKFFKRNRVNKDISNDAGATSTENLLT